MQKSYIKYIIILLLIIVANVTIARSQSITNTDNPYSKKVEFSLDDFNIVRTLDTVEISTDNPNYFFLEEEGAPAIPYTIISIETEYFRNYTYDIDEVKLDTIHEKVYIYANELPHNSKDPIPPRKISTKSALDPVSSISAEIIGDIIRVNLVITPFVYDYWEKRLSFISSHILSLALSGPQPGNSIENISSSDREVKTENNYDLSGRPVETPTSGLTIKVTENPDGSRETKKIIVK